MPLGHRHGEKPWEEHDIRDYGVQGEGVVRVPPAPPRRPVNDVLDLSAAAGRLAMLPALDVAEASEALGEDKLTRLRLAREVLDTVVSAAVKAGARRRGLRDGNT